MSKNLGNDACPRSEDPATFRVAATDTKGHSTRHWFRSIPQLSGQVQAVVESRVFNYKSKGDLLRHALMLHLKWLQKLKPGKSVLGQAEAILEILRDEENNREFDIVFAKLSERIEAHQRGQAEGEAARLVLIVMKHIEEMPDGFWKEKYKEKVARKYGGLLKSVGKAQLGKVSD